MVQITLGIEGMACGMCEAHINDAVRKAFAIKKVNSSHGKGQTIILSERAISEQELKEIIEPTGYTIVSYHCEPYKKKGLFTFGKNNHILGDE